MKRRNKNGGRTALICLCAGGLLILGIMAGRLMKAAVEPAAEAVGTEAAGTETEETETEETEAAETMAVEQEYDRILSLHAGEPVCAGSVSGELTDRLFYGSEIDETLSERIIGCSYTPNDNIALSELSYLRMLYCGTDGNTYVGEMIVNRSIETEVLEIFRELYEQRYPIEKMVLIDNYDAEDEASMEDNNTSAFNYRTVSGSDKLSNHSYGMAIDLNPKYNPYVKIRSDGTVLCQPESGRAYADRSADFAYKIDENDLAYRLFTRAGFTWGGSWNSVKDYQHFEKEF